MAKQLDEELAGSQKGYDESPEDHLWRAVKAVAEISDALAGLEEVNMTRSRARGSWFLSWPGAGSRHVEASPSLATTAARDSARSGPAAWSTEPPELELGTTE